ncbi:uncharacterized protein J4E84_010792 [Alternaria hordeiaustralica]|uniref:uncharacterized protein n=1 Tax=Alternaria hordeiaustralica TaxID=1187925 RepID=UPI0020C2CD54|nr:uncharacterized protein J4E84_010792 [Alternaria hordeiaustralica]KAI4674179.1 hypothetical protein J4E84_010792 [Alternaria hordeiaustralica]
MAEAARNQLYLTFKNLLASGNFSDLTVTCGPDSYKVHKNVVCSRAEFFSRAVKFGGKETEQGSVDLPEDEPAIVKLMMQYIYQGEYDPALPDNELSGSTKITVPPTPTPPHKKSRTARQLFLMIHAKLYEIADKYDVVGLKELVIEKFKRACHSFWNDPSFANAAHHVFSTTPEHDKGLRDIVSKTIAEHMAELVKKPEVEALLTEFNGLAFGLLKMKTEAGWK